MVFLPKTRTNCCSNGSTIIHLVGVVLLILVFISWTVKGNDILGCGGFVKSPYKLDFDQIEIKLFTKQGSLKLKTEAAPNSGYFFIPLENKGNYVLKISSPDDSWTFEPPSYSINFDGETDQCSKGEDVNFEFKGFSVMGKVISSGFKEGPAGLDLLLESPTNKVKLKGISGEGGSFHFDSIPPGGPYTLKVMHEQLEFEKQSYTFTISNNNIVVDGELVVSGYELKGTVKSDGNGVEKVTIVLVGENKPKGGGCEEGKTEGINLPQDVKGKILCVSNSDKDGVFKFGGLSPGNYIVVPVYRGTNIVYSVSPDRLEVKVGHGSVQLKKAFEVEGFRVQGRVKGHSGAKVLVNGQLKATSGHDGTFSIPKMKPGTYDFEVIADKFLFEKKKISIQPTNPVIPDFVPSKFEQCGSINVKSKSSPELTLAFQRTGSDEVILEKITGNPNQACVYLPEGSFTGWVNSKPQKFFVPLKQALQVPSGTRFNFQEFSGSISGLVSSKFSSCEGVKIRVESGNTLIQEKILGPDGKFIFDNLESGVYRINVDTEKFCWKASSVEKIELKNINVDNIQFIQTGFPLEIKSSHATSVKISGKTPAANQVLQLVGGVSQKICLSDPNSPPESYKIIPEGCHNFEQKEYLFRPGERMELVAKRHSHSWIINAPFEIPDLKVTRNGESFGIEDVNVVKEVKGKRKDDPWKYEVTWMEEPGHVGEWQVFSYGFIFEPTTFTIEAESDCRQNLIQVLAKKSHVLKGKFSPPLEGVEIRIDLVGDPDSTLVVTSNTLGEYIAGPFVHPSGFKVTPQKNGYIFKPKENDPYSFTVYQLAKIRVRVESAEEKSLGGVLLSLSGPNSYRQNRVTDPGGEIGMEFSELQPGTYYLKALLKEFQFQPSALNIELKEQESKEVVLKAIRESFSLYGALTSLSGELMPHLLVSAVGQGNCSEYSEEGISNDVGHFRIWALKSYCNYKVSVVKKDEFANRVERTIPETLEVKIGNEDILNASFVIISPVRRMDVSLRVFTNNEKALDNLKAVVYSAPDNPLHSTPFNGISYIILPPIPKDHTDYFISFESTLNKFQYTYSLPQDIHFPANQAYAHFSIHFNIDPAPVDQDIGKNSYIAFAIIVLVVLAIANYERVGIYGKEMIETYFVTGGKKSKPKTK